MKTRIPVSARRRQQRGSAIVETALAFSAFLLMTFGLMEFSMAVYAYNFCSYSARDAARFASVHGSQSPNPTNADQVQTMVRNQAVGLLSSGVNVTTQWLPDSNPGSQVKVTVAYGVIPLTGLAIKDVLNVASSSQMMIVH